MLFRNQTQVNYLKGCNAYPTQGVWDVWMEFCLGPLPSLHNLPSLRKPVKQGLLLQRCSRPCLQGI